MALSLKENAFYCKTRYAKNMKVEYNEALTETFLRYYRELESIRDLMPEEYSFYQRKYSREFEGFRQIRNFLSHEAYKAKDCVAVSSAVVNDIVMIQKEMGRSVYDIATKKILSCRPSSPFREVLELMSENDLTYLPILENDHSVLGVISANDILDLLVSRPRFSRELIVDDFLPSHFSFAQEHSHGYVFLSRKEPAYRASEVFSTLAESKHRVGLILITENGKREEALLGVITPADLIRHKVN